MAKIKILNKKETKRILEAVEKQWGYCPDFSEYAFLETERSKVYIVNRKCFQNNLDNLKINSLGYYFCETQKGIRLSIEGSQIIGPKAKKNIVELDKEETRKWMAGEDLDKTTDCEGFVILKFNNDFLGTGKAMPTQILNFIPKIRRVNII